MRWEEADDKRPQLQQAGPYKGTNDKAVPAAQPGELKPIETIA